jgi:hypothetical protein
MKKLILFFLAFLLVSSFSVTKVEAAYVAYGHLVFGGAHMTDSTTLTVQLQDMPTSEYNGLAICDYFNPTICNTDFIVGSGGITYTYSDSQFTSVSIDVKPSVLGTSVALGLFPLDTSNNYVGPTSWADHATVTLTDAPLTVAGISESGDRTIFMVGGYSLNSNNAFVCRITGVTDSLSVKVKYRDGYTTSNSCSFSTSEVNAIENTNTAFYLQINDIFDSQEVTTQNYTFAEFESTPTPTPTPAPTLTILTPVADTYIKNGHQNENEGASTFFRLQSSGHNRALIKFDEQQIQQAVGDALTFTATLQLTISDNGNNWGSNGRSIDLTRFIHDWEEGNGYIVGNSPSNRGTDSGVTWNCAIDANINNHNDDCSGTTVWDMNNSSFWPFISTPTATTTINNNQTGTITFDVTSDIQSFVNGTNQNYGWLLKKTDEGANGRIEFGSKESASSPKLIITTY